MKEKVMKVFGGIFGFDARKGEEPQNHLEEEASRPVGGSYISRARVQCLITSIYSGGSAE